MIFGERVRLHAAERSDLPLFVTWLNDLKGRQGLCLYQPLSLAEGEQWFDKMVEKPVEEHPSVIELYEEDAWRAIGNCSPVSSTKAGCARQNTRMVCISMSS